MWGGEVAVWTVLGSRAGVGSIRAACMERSLDEGTLLVAGVDVLLLLEGFLLAQFELARLQQSLIRTVAVQRDQLYIFRCLLAGSIDELFKHTLMHEKLQGHFGIGVLIIGFDEVVEYLGALLDDEGDGPGEEVHEVGEEVGVGALHELLNV
jgi:hypothetical protein